MNNLPAALRATLAEHYALTALQALQQECARDGTTRTLFQLADGQTVETVYIPEAERATVCVSTQVGCPFGCVFCATGQSGFTREFARGGDRRSSLSRAGLAAGGAAGDECRLHGHGRAIGELRRRAALGAPAHPPAGLEPGRSGISRCPPWASPRASSAWPAKGLQVNLAISLHAPTQQGRLRLLPIAKNYELAGLMAAVRRYVQQTGRKVTFEYTVLPGRNDSEEDAAGLAELLRGLQAMVNVIPLNPDVSACRATLQLAPAPAAGRRRTLHRAAAAPPCGSRPAPLTRAGSVGGVRATAETGARGK